MARKRLGELLVATGLLDEHQLRAALGEQRKFGRPLGRVLVDMGLVQEMAIVNVLSQQLNIPMIDLGTTRPRADALEQLDARFCDKHCCIPIAYQPSGKFLDVAMADPTNPAVYDEIRVLTRCNVRPYLAAPTAIEGAINSYYHGIAPQFESGAWQIDRWQSLPGEQVFDPGAGSSPSSPAPPHRGEARFDPATEPVHIGGPPIVSRPPTAPQPQSQPLPATETEAELELLRAELAQLKVNLQRTDRVLKLVMQLLVEKGLVKREELLQKIKR
ncbi:MAG: hypothetical protein H6707_12100 [Deltaproteobacteria bacterium]|nr:hypothetical protein [Deltaproteobacteria bacterium]